MEYLEDWDRSRTQSTCADGVEDAIDDATSLWEVSIYLSVANDRKNS